MRLRNDCLCLERSGDSAAGGWVGAFDAFPVGAGGGGGGDWASWKRQDLKPRAVEVDEILVDEAVAQDKVVVEGDTGVGGG